MPRPTDLSDIELVAESYAKIYQAIANGHGPTSGFRAYLFTTVRSVAASWGRRSRETPIDDADTLEDPASSEAAGLEALDRSLTATAFRSLPTRWQEVLWYGEVERMKPAQIAPLLGMSANAVAALAYRAREGLRQAWIQAHLASVPEGSDCRWTTERLGAYARGGLGKRETAKVEGHLLDCARCTIVAAEAKDVGSRIALVLLPLVAGVGGAGAYTAWMQSGAHTVPYAAGSAGAVLPAAAGGVGATPAVAGTATPASAPGGAAGSSGAGGAGGAGATVTIASFAVGGLLVAAAVAAAVVLAPTLFPSAPTPTGAAVADPASPAAPPAASAPAAGPSAPSSPPAQPPVPPPAAPPVAPADPIAVATPAQPASPSIGAPAAAAPSTPSTPSEPTRPTVPRPPAPALSAAYPADGHATNASALDAAGTASPAATIVATAAPATTAPARVKPASASSSTSADASAGASAVSGTVPLGSTSADAAGAWGLSLDLSALGDGTWTVSFTQATAAGVSDAVSRALVIDRTAQPPLLTSVDTGSGPAAGAAAPIVTGTAEPGATVEVSDGDRLLTTVTAGADGSWSTGELVLASRAFALTARQTDALGNVSAPSAATTGSVLAPSITASALLSTVTVTAYGLPSTRMLLYVDGAPTGQTLDTAADGTAAATYLWVGPSGVHRIGFGYDLGGRRGIVSDAPITLPGTP